MDLFDGPLPRRYTFVRFVAPAPSDPLSRVETILCAGPSQKMVDRVQTPRNVCVPALATYGRLFWGGRYRQDLRTEYEGKLSQAVPDLRTRAVPEIWPVATCPQPKIAEGHDPSVKGGSPPNGPHAQGGSEADLGPAGEFHLLGPPGTGKTTALTTTWIPKAIERYGSKAVAVCSLTRTAAAELASRQVVALPRERVGTLHSFARAALTDFMGKPELAQTAESIERWNEEVARGDKGLILTGSGRGALDAPRASTGIPAGYQRAARGREARAAASGAPDGDTLMNEIEVLRHRMVPVGSWPEGVRRLWTTWQKWKQDEQIFDFTDLISVALENGTAPPTLDGVKVTALFVDEAQDFSKLEMALVRSWQEQVRVCVLSGDPNQSIYGFRGAEAHAFHDAASFPKDRTYVLGQSYRLPKNIQARAESWLGRADSATPLDYKPRVGDAGQVVAAQVTMSDRNAGRLADEVARELERLKDHEGDHRRVMILASAAFMLRPIIAELRKRRVVYCNPYQKDRGDWNPLKTAHTRIVSLFAGPCPYLTGDDGPGGREPRLWTWGELKRWTDVVQTKGLLLHGAKANIIARESKKRGRVIIDNGDLERIFVDAASIRRDVIPMLQHRAQVREALDWFKVQLTVAHSRALAFALGVAARDIMQIMEEPRVVVGTIHSVKGGTAGTVILAPDLAQKHAAERDGSSEGFAGMVRLFYVGMTRASSRLILLQPMRRNGRLLPHVQW